MWIATKRSEHSENAEGRVCQVIGFRWSGSGQDEGKIHFGGVFFPSETGDSITMIARSRSRSLFRRPEVASLITSWHSNSLCGLVRPKGERSMPKLSGPPYIRYLFGRLENLEEFDHSPRRYLRGNCAKIIMMNIWIACAASGHSDTPKTRPMSHTCTYSACT